MAINPTCDFCGEELVDYGALLFSAPDANGMAKKDHVCKACYERLVLLKKNNEQ
ncbi:MAG: hypothetical protein WC763_00495 [Candidatus Paceibacterota bacterium]|jgi:hypothetical protein